MCLQNHQTREESGRRANDQNNEKWMMELLKAGNSCLFHHIFCRQALFTKMNMTRGCGSFSTSSLVTILTSGEAFEGLLREGEGVFLKSQPRITTNHDEKTTFLISVGDKFSWMKSNYTVAEIPKRFLDHRF
jgi:hypothetical protein